MLMMAKMSMLGAGGRELPTFPLRNITPFNFGDGYFGYAMPGGHAASDLSGDGGSITGALIDTLTTDGCYNPDASDPTIYLSFTGNVVAFLTEITHIKVNGVSYPLKSLIGWNSYFNTTTITFTGRPFTNTTTRSIQLGAG